MGKSIKFSNDTWLDATGVIMNDYELPTWLAGRVYRTTEFLGTFNSYFDAQRGYKSKSITIPANTVYIVTGLFTGTIADSNQIQITGLYNVIYVNNTNSNATYDYWFNYDYPIARSTSLGNVSLEILAIKLK